jgi:hypothetical protein
VQIILYVLTIIIEKVVDGNKLINSMEQILSCGPKSLSVSQEIPLLLRNHNHHCRVHKCPRLLTVRVKIKSIREQTSSPLPIYVSDVTP